MGRTERLIAAQEAGWTDCFIQNGEVWGYANPGDVMPWVFPEEKQKPSHCVAVGQRAILDFMEQESEWILLR